MRTREALLPPKLHKAVERWRETFIPDYDYLLENWDQYFPKEPVFRLCAFRELGMCDEIECGDEKGQPKLTRARDLSEERGHHLLGAIKAQASTEFGSIQQHRLTLARAQSAEEQIWVMRMMAEELRHGYQMLHLLSEDDWSAYTEQSSEDMVEEILAMQTGSHILGAFNVDFDSFADNITFCALIDRVGKYQLTMQKVSAYKPMAESMPRMLREEAFHLATGVVPMRRWVTAAAKGEIFITTEMLQKVVNKWLPRGLEMFGDERGGASNVRMGLKPQKNEEAQIEYYDEVLKLVDDLNMRFIRTRLPKLSQGDADKLYEKLRSDGGRSEGVDADELLYTPHRDFFRRRGVPAFRLTGARGETFDEYGAYLEHLRRHLPESYLASSDFKEYAEKLGEVVRGELTADEAGRKMRTLRRVAATCPCSKSVRWVRDEAEDDGGNGS